MTYQHADKRFTHDVEVIDLMTTGELGVVTSVNYCLVTTQVSNEQKHRSQSKTLRLAGANYGAAPAVPFDDLTKEILSEWIIDQDDRFIRAHLLRENLMFFLVPKPPEPPQEVLVDAPWETAI